MGTVAVGLSTCLKTCCLILKVKSHLCHGMIGRIHTQYEHIGKQVSTVPNRDAFKGLMLDHLSPILTLMVSTAVVKHFNNSSFAVGMKAMNNMLKNLWFHRACGSPWFID